MKRFLTYGVGLAPAFALLLALGLARAEPPDSADSPQATRTRAVPAFHGIELAGVLTVEATAGKPASVTISGDADLVDQVTTTVKDGVLVINTPEHRRDHSRRNRRLHAAVTAPDLSSLAITGTGTLKATGIANDRLAIDVPGTGTLKLSGSTGALNVRLGGTGEVTGKDLAARDLVIDIDGTGSARLNATRSVEARIAGTGSLDVHGHPSQVRKTVTGLGSVHIE
jgi:Putative auto-transporter adhesin, head GIN domain